MRFQSVVHPNIAVPRANSPPIWDRTMDEVRSQKKWKIREKNTWLKNKRPEKWKSEDLWSYSCGNNAGRLGSGFISVCLETHWLGQKSGFYVPERYCSRRQFGPVHFWSSLVISRSFWETSKLVLKFFIGFKPCLASQAESVAVVFCVF